LLHNKAIYMPAGNKPNIASYAVADGKFAAAGQGRGKHLFVRNGQVKGTGFPLYWRPDDDHFLTPLELETPAGVLDVATARIALHTGDAKKPAWFVDKPFAEIAAVAVGKNAVIVTGVNRDKAGAVTLSGMCAIQLSDGKVLWRESLPAPPVAWGAALDRDGQIVVTMTDGRVAAFQGK